MSTSKQLQSAIRSCRRCGQYAEECECCLACGGSDVHEYDCTAEAETAHGKTGRTPVYVRTPSRRTFRARAANQTLRGLGPVRGGIYQGA